MPEPANPPRIALIHALRESVEPARLAFAEAWPQARVVNLLEDSLSADLAADGALAPAMTERFLRLAGYVVDTGARGILFTCSAFGAAIDAVKAAHPDVPILKPNEAALDAALAAGSRIGLLATFPATVPSMTAEIEALAAARGRSVRIEARCVEGALSRLQAGRPEEHDRLIAAEAERLPPVDALLLAQFSMARAARAIAPRGRLVVTTPDSAVARLKALLV